MSYERKFLEVNQEGVLEILNTIDFGNPDGLYDYNLKSYFLDNGYWNRIIESDKFFVIGRKGTGKSAIYNWIKTQDESMAPFIQNLSFTEFPFEKFLTLSDDDFARPNQYQSIWKNLILIEFSNMLLQDQSNPAVEELNELKKYFDFCFGGELTDLHKSITTKISKTALGLVPHIGLSRNSEASAQSSHENEKITFINRRLESLILNYRKKFKRNCYYIQFDQLDDNYNYFADKRKYLESIISLCKVVYKLNNNFRMEGADLKIIVYLRSDIYNQISSLDPESSRWANYKFQLDWGLRKEEMPTPKLKVLINKRINKFLKCSDENDAFNVLFEQEWLRLVEGGKRKSAFWYMINRTFDRPRDIIQFCLCVQEEARITRKLDWQVFRQAERNYSHWFIDEIANEVGPDIKNMETLLKFLRSLGSSPFSYKHFADAFIRGKFFSLSMEPEHLINYLYKHGIINNVNFNLRPPVFYSSIRNERSQYDQNLLAVINKGLLAGMDIYH
jgi:hypothetical protein